MTDRDPATPLPPTAPDKGRDRLEEEIAALRAELQVLNAHRYLHIQNSRWRMMGHAFLRGLATGLGTVVGATVLVSIMVYALSQIDFIPIVGDWATRIADEIQAPQ